MSNYDFLLDHTDFSEEFTIKTGNEIIFLWKRRSDMDEI